MTELEISLKESFLYKDISWMMQDFDLKDFLDRMKWKIYSETSSHYVIFCPDHSHFTGKEPSHPKFYIDKKSGKTQCKTEGRGSNLLWTVKRLLNCTANDAYKFIVGKEHAQELDVISWNILKSKLQNNSEEDFSDEEESFEIILNNIKAEISKKIIKNSGYDYFMYPPNKKPTLIEKDTLDYFKCFQCEYGFYKDRVFVPVYLKEILTGFVAIDILGEEKNKKLYPDKEYKKLLYPKGFKSGSNLFNYDNVEDGAEYIIIVEGVRDAMKLWQLGYKNVVALFGVNISQEQCLMISKKYPDLCYIMLDGDEAGFAAASKISKKICKFINTKISILPRKEDPKTVSKIIIDNVLKKSLIVNEKC